MKILDTEVPSASLIKLGLFTTQISSPRRSCCNLAFLSRHHDLNFKVFNHANNLDFAQKDACKKGQIYSGLNGTITLDEFGNQILY
jgi:hypothetical protein